MASRSYDIIVYGVTGFAGRLTGEYLARNAPAGVKWAIAGRSAGKLAAVQKDLEAIRRESQPGATDTSIPVVIASSSDPASLVAMTEQTRVIVTTVGPYMLYGEPLVRAAVSTSTSYLDLTGESIWVADMIKKHGDAAKSSGALIIPAAGFDSVPSDLCTLMMVDHAKKKLNVPGGVSRVETTFTVAGGASGGTLASGLNMLRFSNLKSLFNPISCCPSTVDGRPVTSFVTALKDRSWVAWNKTFNCYTAPFFMAPTNTRVVRRSASLAAGVKDDAYSTTKPFTYEENMKVKSWLQGVVVSVGSMVGPALLLFPPTRFLVSKLVTQPGSGPSAETRAKSFYNVRVSAVTDEAEPRTITGHASGRDPGYDETAKMLAEAALTIALTDPAELPGFSKYGAGFLTPATALGMPYLARLRAAGLTFAVDEGAPQASKL